MLRQRRKTDIKSDMMHFEEDVFVERNFQNSLLQDYFKFAIYCMLLLIPLYAITISILKHDWMMAVIDALIVPVGFIHGLLLLLGFVN